jgi:hypothetical protein
MELAEVAAEGGGGADVVEEGPTGESRAGEARYDREMQEYLAEKVIVVRPYGGGSWRRRQRWLWGGYGCEFTELEEPVEMYTHRLWLRRQRSARASKQQNHACKAGSNRCKQPEAGIASNQQMQNSQWPPQASLARPRVMVSAARRRLATAARVPWRCQLSLLILPPPPHQ